jgi:hypothetical protein
MAVFPRETHTESLNAQDHFLSRWIFPAAAFLIVLLGLLPGLVKDVELWRGLQAADKASETPHLSKREPLRALAATDRKEGAGIHTADADGAVLPESADTAYLPTMPATAANLSAEIAPISYWPAPLPRAPPPAS